MREVVAAELEEVQAPDTPEPEYPPEPILSVDMPGPLKVDLFSQYVRWLVLVVALILVLMSLQLAPDVQVPEYLGTLLLAVAGMMVVASAQELVLLFVGLELISIPTYILLYLGRRSVESQEATAKYFYLSILSSAITLYGFSFLYGAAGSTELVRIQEALGSIDETMGMLWFGRLALVLIFAGLCFKVTAVPFHFYAPDVYQGTTAGNAAVLSFLPKLGGLVVLVRIVAMAMPGFETYAWQIALVLALLTMTLGNVVALWQDNVRRLLAYSSIAHGGYMLIGLAVAFAAGSGANAAAGFDGIGGMLFYITVYALATSGAFATLIYLGRDERPIENVDELAGAARAYPWAGIAMAIFMFSLTGIPPLAGFWGKLNLFAGALSIRPPNPDAASAPREWFLLLAVLGVLNAAISAGYYLRIVGVMYFRNSSRELKRKPPGGRARPCCRARCWWCSWACSPIRCKSAPMPRRNRPGCRGRPLRRRWQTSSPARWRTTWLRRPRSIASEPVTLRDAPGLSVGLTCAATSRRVAYTRRLSERASVSPSCQEHSVAIPHFPGCAGGAGADSAVPGAHAVLFVPGAKRLAGGDRINQARELSAGRGVQSARRRESRFAALGRRAAARSDRGFQRQSWAIGRICWTAVRSERADRRAARSQSRQSRGHARDGGRGDLSRRELRRGQAAL